MQATRMPSVSDGFGPRQPVYRPTLSSEIVRPVLQRVSARMDTTDRDTQKATQQRFLGFSPQPTAASFRSKSHSSRSSGLGGYRQQEPEVAPQYRASVPAFDPLRYRPTSSDDVVPTCASQQASNTEMEPFLQWPKRIRLQTARRRQQCRANQARYRQKQLVYNKTLEHTVLTLRANIPVLELQRNRLQYGGNHDVWNVVVEYFHTFRFGALMTLPETLEGRAHRSINEIKYRENAETKRQLAFLRSSMTDNVMLGERSGVETLMKQWVLYSLSFQNLYFRLERIERTNNQFVGVTAVLNVTVSEETLRGVFPHLLHRGAIQGEVEAAKAASLRSRMIGQRLLLPCSLCFEWDASICRVVLLETTVNFMKPLMEVLGNLSDVAMVLGGARITRDGSVGIRAD
ncbi:bZIP transcription factor 1 [Phytophthora ramorum]|uniref:bZIP transcription factor 1 n=1 Tax=Phytophthora ramorum TaxID=164328 RepID=UPI0030A1FEB5|nr:bZIP transcription factor 1 [Phytophthora ramorum]